MQEFEVIYQGPITIYFAKPVHMPDSNGKVEPRSRLMVNDGKLIRSDNPASFTILNDDGGLFQINFDTVAFYVLHRFQQAPPSEEENN